MAFLTKHINLTFKLGAETLDAAGNDTVSYAGLRVQAVIETGGTHVMPSAALKIYGMPFDLMNQLSILGGTKITYTASPNVVAVEAFEGDENGRVLFVGNINEAWIDARNAPDIGFLVSAYTGLIPALKPVDALSYKGNVAAADIAEAIAASMGLKLENSGVDIHFHGAYHPGTALTQLEALARAAPFEYAIEGDVLAIWPVTGARGTGGARIAADTGLIGYPDFSERSLEASVLFNPNLRVGSAIEMESAIARVNGSWKLYRVAHTLESETPGGKWQTDVSGRLIDFRPAAANG